MTEGVANSKLVLEIEKWWYDKKCWPRSVDMAAVLEMSIADVEKDYDISRSQLKRRGVDRMLKAGEFTPTELDELRHSVALAISNIHDPQRLAAKLKQHKITETQYRGWLQDPLFSSFVERRSEELIVEEFPEVSKTLTRKASQGDLRATKMLLELTGRLSTSKNQVNIFNDRDTSMYIVRQLVEVIKVHVRDPEILEAIARDFDNIMGVGTANRGMSLEAGSFEDRLDVQKVREARAIGTDINF